MRTFHSLACLMILILFCQSANAQLTSQIHINDNPGQVVNTCGSLLGTTFTDSQSDTTYLFGFPISSSYGNNENFTKTICSDNGQNIQFDFSSFSLGTGDVLSVYDGNSTSGPLLGTYSGNSSPGVLLSSGTCLTFTFISDANQTGDGWSASISCINVISIDETGTENTCNAPFFDSGILGVYGPNENFVKTICPSGSDCIKVSFSNIDIEAGVDFLYVYQGSTIDPANLLATITGNDASQVVFSEEGCLTFHFVSDGSGNNEGWEGVLSCPDLCGVPPCAGGSEAAADACSDAPAICDLNGYCGNTSSDYTPDLPGNFCDMNTPLGCNLFQGSIENNSWLKFWASGDTASFQVWVPDCSSGSGIQMGIYEATDCNGFILKSDPALTSSSQNQNDFVIMATGLTQGQTYYIMVDGVGGSVCDYVVAAESGVAFGNTITPDHTICLGVQDTISIEGGEDWLWTSNPPDPNLLAQNTNDVIYVSPVQTTTYTVEISGGGTGGWTPPDCNSSSVLSTVVYVDDCSECTTPSFDFEIIEPLCFGDNITVEFTNLAIMSNPAYLWSIPAGINIVSGSTDGPGPLVLSSSMPGSYSISLQITDNDGSQDCVPYTSNVTIVYPESIDLTGSIVNESVPAACDGNIDLSVSGGTPPLTYSWSTGGSSEDIVSLCPGGYSVTVTDVQGCSIEDNFQVNGEGCTLTASIQVTSPISCFGVCDGVAEVGTSGAQGQTNYMWSDNSITYNNTGLCSGLSSVIVTDEWGCVATAEVTLSQPSEVIITDIVSGNISCNNASDGSMIISASGGTGTLSYDLNGIAQSTGNYSNLQSGSYTAIVTDAVGCSATAGPVNITEPSEIQIMSVQSTDVTCFGDANGSISIVATGGSGVLSYSTGVVPQTSGIFSNLSPSVYTITVSDENGCSVVFDASINQPDELIIISEVSEDVSCFGLDDGSITVEALGGVPPLNYILSGSAQQTGEFNEMEAGAYTVTITDMNGCSTQSSSLVVNTPPELIIQTESVTGITCFGYNDGEINLNASGGTGTILYQINNQIQANGFFTGLSQGIYTVQMIDENGCSISSSPLFVAEPAELQFITLTSGDISCNGLHDGWLNASAQGGSGAIQYSANGTNQQTGLFTGLGKGDYLVTVQDYNGCSESAGPVFIQEPEELHTAAIITDLDCYSSESGAIDLSVSGGSVVNDYSYHWSNGSYNQDVGNLAAGSYQVTVTDNNNCVMVSSFLVEQPDPLVIATNNDSHICDGQTLDIHVSATGGTSPYFYSWNGSQSSQNITVSPQQTTTYTANVVDSHGCEAFEFITINVFPPLNLDISLSDDTLCKGDPFIASASFSGGDGGPYSLYVVDETGEHTLITPPYTFYPDQSGSINFALYDNCGTNAALDEAQYWVIQSPDIVVTSDVASGCVPLEVHFNESGSTDVETYIWTFGDNGVASGSNPVHVFEEEGVYDVTLMVTSSMGCTNFYTYEDYVSVYPIPDADFLSDLSNTTILKPEVSFDNYSTQAAHYLWIFGDGDSASAVNPVHAYPGPGKYDVMLYAISEAGCMDSISSDVTIEDVYTFYAPTAFTPDRNGHNDYFYVLGSGIDRQEFRMMIFDRWGEKVFESDQYDENNPESYGWDGKIKGRAIAQNGTYSWYVVYRDIGGTEHEKSGVITVIR